MKTIEENGGVVVCFENCSGIKAAFQMVDEDAADITRAVAQRYLQIGCSVMTPNNRRLDNLKKLVRDYKIDGVVELDLTACSPYAIEAYQIKELMAQLDVPYLAVETDYSSGDSGGIATRLEAFLEML